MLTLLIFVSFQDSLYRKHFSESILKLQESGILNDLKNKWWSSDKGKGSYMESLELIIMQFRVSIVQFIRWPEKALNVIHIQPPDCHNLDSYLIISHLVCPEYKHHDYLGIANVGGVFIVLAGGCLVAFVIALIEFLSNVEKIAVEEKASATSFQFPIFYFPLLNSDFTLWCLQIGNIVRVQGLEHIEAGSL